MEGQDGPLFDACLFSFAMSGNEVGVVAVAIKDLIVVAAVFKDEGEVLISGQGVATVALKAIFEVV